MADDDIELAWKLSVEGAEEVKAKITDLHDQFNRGELTVDQYSKGLRGAGSDLRTFTSASQMQTRAWMAAHPAVTQMSRSMSAFTSVMRASLAVSNALNLATIAFQGHSSGMAAMQAELAQAQRDYNQAVIEFGANSPEAEAAMDRIKVSQEKIREANDEMTKQMVMNGITFAASMAFMGGSILTNLPAIINAFKSIRIAMMTTFAAMGPIGWIILGISAALIVLIMYWDEISAAVMWFWENVLSPFLGWLASVFQPIFEGVWAAMVSFATGAWEVLKSGFTAFWNGMITVTNAAVYGLVKGIEWLANSFIDTVNGMIKAYNAVAGLLGLGTLGTIGHISLPVPQIPLVSAATGFEGRLGSDTMFMAHKGENVSITPASQVGSGGGRSVNIYVAGNLWSTRDLLRTVDRAFRSDLSSRNV